MGDPTCPPMGGTLDLSSKAVITIPLAAQVQVTNLGIVASPARPLKTKCASTFKACCSLRESLMLRLAARETEELDEGEIDEYWL